MTSPSLSADRAEQAASRAGYGRSSITNGSALQPDVDGRSVWARMFRDVCSAMAHHVGGTDRMTEPERLVARRVAALEAELVSMEAKFARVRSEEGEPSSSDLDLYSRISNTQRRMLEALGMQRRPRDLTPDPLEYAREKAA